MSNLEQTPNKKKPTKLVEDTPEPSAKPETPGTAGKKNNYWSYKNREGPSALGSKELPRVRFVCFFRLNSKKDVMIWYVWYI